MGGGDVDLFIGYGGRTKMDKRVDSNLLLDMSGMLNDIGFNLDDELGVQIWQSITTMMVPYMDSPPNTRTQDGF